MQQVACFTNGTLDYDKIGGDTGPIVYPAGHLYIYTLLSMLTDGGRDIQLAQYIFAVLYALNVAIVLCIYHKAAIVSTQYLHVLVVFILGSPVHSCNHVLHCLSRAFNQCITHVQRPSGHVDC
jgi:alpha-1,3-mannosyltransferase